MLSCTLSNGLVYRHAQMLCDFVCRLYVNFKSSLSRSAMYQIKHSLSSNWLSKSQKTILFQMILTTVVMSLSYEISDMFHHTVLDRDNRFHLYWKVEDPKKNSFIVFQVEVQTLGYVALGISPHGGMPGSDIVIGWIKEGKTFLQDRHADSNTMPTLDKQQDWELISGYENDTHTVLQFQRKMNTYDKDDFPINVIEHPLEIKMATYDVLQRNDTARIIYAYHSDDPESQDSFPYHTRKQRGTRSIILLQSIVRSNKLPDDVKVWDAVVPNISIPNHVETTYWCKILKAPVLDKKHHVVQIAPLVSAESIPYVHHIILYGCWGAIAGDMEPHVQNSGHPCYAKDMPLIFVICQSIYASWGVGAMDMMMPEKAGLPFGDKENTYFRLEVHYANTDFDSVLIDQSGLRIYYTPMLRTYDAMSLMIGSAVRRCTVIPPHREKFVIAGHADPRCLGPAIPQEGFKIFAVFLHSHLLGRQMKIRHFRNGTELPPIAYDENYDFAYQEYRYLNEEVTVKPGDHLVVECTYNSSDRNKTTFGGFDTTEEMCLAFLLSYPKISRIRALSNPSCDLVKSLAGMQIKKTLLGWDHSEHELHQYFDKNNPWDSNFITIAESAMRFGYHEIHCFTNSNTRIQLPSYITYPRNARHDIDIMDYSQQNFIEQTREDNGALSSAGSRVYVWQAIWLPLIYTLSYIYSSYSIFIRDYKNCAYIMLLL